MTSAGSALDQQSNDGFDFSNGVPMFETMSITSEPAALPLEGSAPTIPESLVAGSPLTKISKNKSDVVRLYLDPSGSRVSWKGRLTTKSFQVDNIQTIRKGCDTHHDTRGEVTSPERCFTINYAASDSSNSTKSLHLQGKDAQEADSWYNTLHSLWKHRQALMMGVMGSIERESTIRAHWEKEMTQHHTKHGIDAPERLDLPAVQNLCSRLHIHAPAKVIETAFEQSDASWSGSLDYDQFKRFLRLLRERKDIKVIFDSIKEPNSELLTPDRLMSFLRDSQGLDLSDVTVRQLWDTRIQILMTASKDVEGIDFAAFSSFMQSNHCHIYATEQPQTPRFDRPLNEYFISSSHNTYLLGWQIKGTSSAEGYITAIRHGCRCVELDCWDGPAPAREPRVTHGRTQTTSVPFADCIAAINRCAFDFSPYPVILSLEVHCNPEQQRKMIQIMEDIFGERLLRQSLKDNETILPSPEQLKYTFLVKVKAVNAHVSVVPSPEDAVAERSPYRKGSAQTSAVSVSPVPILHSPAMTSPSETVYSATDRSLGPTSASSAGEESDIPVGSAPNSEAALSRKAKTAKITSELASLGVYMQGYKMKDARDLAFKQFNHIFSLGERAAEDLNRSIETKAMFEEHNVHYLSRVYPKQTRINSSNFDPNTFWRRGVQMVALNWQTFDEHTQMNNAMFAAGTDAYGYVLKPDYLRYSRVRGGDFEARRKLPRFSINFSIKIISAQQIPRPKNVGKNDALNPFIEVQIISAEDKAKGIASGTGGQESSNNEIHGVGKPYTRHTAVVLGNGWNPQFDETIELSLQTKYPELVFVSFNVFTSSDGRPFGRGCRRLATFTAKLSSLQKGYRHLPLYDGRGQEYIFSTLFCQIKKHDAKLSSSSLQDIADRTPRQSLFRGILNRGMSGDRGRERSSSIEEMRAAHQVYINKEIQERFKK
jgi:phosphatidylinositol phospholipase C, delta